MNVKAARGERSCEGGKRLIESCFCVRACRGCRSVLFLIFAETAGA
jgi:hypothetical protein